MNWNIGKAMALLITAFVVLYVGSCTYKSEVGQRNFKGVRVGDSLDRVLQVMGEPEVTQARGEDAPRGYGGTRCEESCKKRFWYLNRMSLMGEAWSFEIDEKGRVHGAAYWISP